MTVEEMGREIERYCASRESCTDDVFLEMCPLFGNFDCFSPNLIERNYNKLVKEGLIVPSVSEGKGRIIKVHDNVNHPNHYTHGGIECIDAMVSAFDKQTVANFCVCNAFKYIWRHMNKNHEEDINKAIWYLNKYKELEYTHE